MSKKLNSFVRSKSFSFILRNEEMLLGTIERACAGDLKIAGDLQDAFLRVSRFDGAAWRCAGGYWAGRIHKMPARVARITKESVLALRLPEFFGYAAALLSADAQARQQEHLQAAANSKAQALEVHQ